MTGVLVQTFIHIDGTELSSEASALAYRSRPALLTDPAVLAGVGVAVLPVVTPLAAQLGRTLAVEVILEIDALGSVEAGVAGARVKVILAPGAGEARRTRAREPGRGGQLQTRAPVLTRGRAARPGLT